MVRSLLLSIIACLMLQACASPRMSQELEQGKISFETGQYVEAFRELLPVAVNGRPEAQYAVGYMYYYGYGVPQDEESGLFWMRQSADQHYIPAIKALYMIEHPGPDASSAVPVECATPLREPVKPTIENDAILKSIPIKSQPPIVQEPRKIKQKISSRGFSLQVYGDYHLATVKDLQKKLRLSSTSHIYHTTHEGKDWYVLTFGNFTTVQEASATKSNLPDDLRHLKPWVRKTGSLVMV